MVADIPSLDAMWVGIGGGIGAVLRYRVGLFINIKYTGIFPLATFFINVSGGFVIAFLSVMLNIEWHFRYGTIANELLLTGILGGYTTFSTMQLDAVVLMETGKKALCAFYLLISVVSGFIAAGLGVLLAKMMVNL